jgi:UDP-2,3-diacylglucosamine pyrophosphatase LpxH
MSKTLIEQTKPSSNEVCKALQEELDYGTVEYVEGNREFMFLNHGERANITDVYGDKYKVTGFYKSSTIILIGRFYEGLEND